MLLRNYIMENHLKLVGKLHLCQQLQLWKALDFRGKFFLLLQTSYASFKSLVSLKIVRIANPRFQTRFLLMPSTSHSCNDRRYSYLTTNISNRYADSFQTLFEHDRKHV